MEGQTYLFADIGNTAMDLALFSPKTGKKESLKIDATGKTEIALSLRSLLTRYPDLHAYVSSVNKPGLDRFLSELEWDSVPFDILDQKKREEYAKKEGYDFPNIGILGADLFCETIARDPKDGLIILDLGTATKITVLTSQKVFLGGMIMPGIPSFPFMLFKDTDLLGRNPLLENPKVIAYSTRECISSGAINGTAAALAGMVKKIKEEQDMPSCRIVLTGGNAPFVKDVLPSFGLSGFEKDKFIVNEGLAKAFGYPDYLLLKEEF
ncbi:MAG: type III pantothenate kinase [Bacilli bacterium]|jgi:pantothenate kinase type III